MSVGGCLGKTDGKGEAGGIKVRMSDEEDRRVRNEGCEL